MICNAIMRYPTHVYDMAWYDMMCVWRVAMRVYGMSRYGLSRYATLVNDMCRAVMICDVVRYHVMVCHDKMRCVMINYARREWVRLR